VAQTINLKELNGLADEIAKASSKTEQSINNAVHRFAILLHAKSVEKIQKGKRSGVKYRRRSIVHTASAAGEPPKTDTGRLVASIRPVFGKMSAEVGSLANIARYGEMLEKGTKNMAARPWLEPTLKENSGEFTKMMDIAIKSGGLAE
jgi:HK97 gp10 family phage protein